MLSGFPACILFVDQAIIYYLSSDGKQRRPITDQLLPINSDISVRIRGKIGSPHETTKVETTKLRVRVVN